jgi:hypothetical protein
MNPKKPKEFIKPTAEALGLSETLVDDVTGFYWASVRKALSDLESPSITVTNLGTFKARYNKISLLQKKYQAYLDNLTAEKMTFNKHTIQNTSKQKLEGLDKVKKQLEEEYQRKQEVKQKRQEYVTNKNMEK